MLTAVVLYYKNWPMIVTTIDRLLGQLPAGAGLVVVDNASGDGAVAKLQRQFPTVHFIVRVTNGGYAAGMNDGLREAERRGSDFALLLTHECLLAAGAVSSLLRHIQADDTVALAGPLLSTQFAPARVFSAGGRLKGRALLPVHLDWSEGDAQNLNRSSYGVDWIDGACMLVRLSAAQKVGLFDESFFLYVEEVEFAVRLRRVGHQVVCVTEAQASQSTGGIPPYYEARNQAMLSRLHGRRGAVALSLVHQGVCIARDLRHGRAAAARQRVLGLTDFWRKKTSPRA